MINWNETVGSLRTGQGQDAKLRGIFDTFASAFCTEASKDNFFVNGLTCERGDGDSHFYMKFCGRTVRCEFQSLLSDGRVTGAVKYTLERDMGNGEIERIDLGKFGLQPSGETTEKDQDDDPICMDSDLGPSILNLHFLHRSLTR